MTRKTRSYEVTKGTKAFCTIAKDYTQALENYLNTFPQLKKLSGREWFAERRLLEENIKIREI